jgi:uncharacterized membrane protein
LLSFIPLIGWAMGIVVFLFWLVAIYDTAVEKVYLVPFLGQYFEVHLDFIQ